MCGNVLSLVKKMIPVLLTGVNLMAIEHPVFALKNTLKLKVEAPGGYSDETVVRFISNATPGFDPAYDASKFFSSGSAVPSMFTAATGGINLSINSLPDLVRDTLVEIYVSSKTAGNHLVTVQVPGAFDDFIDIELTDIATGNSCRVSSGTSVSIYIGDTLRKVRLTVKFSGVLPKAFFTASGENVELSGGEATVSFINLSQSATEYSWDFGDGTFSLLKDPVKVFTAAGTYRVRLIACNRVHCDSFERAVTIMDVATFNSGIKKPEERYIRYAAGEGIYLKLPGSAKDRVKVTVFDLTGRLFYRGKGQASSGDELYIPIVENAEQFLVVTVQDESGDIYTFRIAW